MEGNDPCPCLPLECTASSTEFVSRFVLDTTKNLQGSEAMQHSLGVLQNNRIATLEQFPTRTPQTKPLYHSLVFPSVNSQTSSLWKQGFIAMKNSVSTSDPDEALNWPICMLPLVPPSCIYSFSCLTDRFQCPHKGQIVQSYYGIFISSDWDFHTQFFRVLLFSCNIFMLLHFYPSHTASLRRV